MSNRLAQETSPYLLQHKDNPVDWYPWGEEALERAEAEDKPILLSIGYSSCHWCHVMERESFDDPETAALMNEHFVSVKVDREERPDVDSVYMTAVQSMTGRGGWPLTVFLTPEGAPFYGGTYFPPERRQGMPSFRQVLQATRDAYRERRDQVEETAEEIRGVLRRSTVEAVEAGSERGPGGPGPELLGRAAATARSRFDPEHGGFGTAPKFPQPLSLEMVLRWHARSGDRSARTLVTHTLRKMARGGIHDHLAGGFHRYSVDARWLVPHFEKMLYDNALLARLYARTWQVAGDGELRDVAERTLDYMVHDLRGPEGGFYSARDADSEGEEGRYYVWSEEEVDAVLEPDEARLFKRCYDVSAAGNWEGTNILHLPHDLDALARVEGLSTEDLADRLSSARDRLREARSRREAPFRDEKVLAGWNGLAVRAFAEAGAIFGRDDRVETARSSAAFLLDALRGDGRLHRSWKDGERAPVQGFLEDYAGLGNALLSLHEATLEPRWLVEARWLAERCLDLFWADDEGLFYDAPRDGEELVVRPRDVMDNPAPSGNSLAVELLLRLSRTLGEERYREVALRVLERESGAMARHPLAFGALLSALDFHLGPPLEIAVVGERDDPRTGELRAAALRSFHPGRVVTGREPEEELSVPVPLLEDRGPVNGRPAAYVCREFACRAPVTDPQELEEEMAAMSREEDEGTGA